MTPAPILEDPNRGLLRTALHAFYDTVWWVAILLASPWWVGRSLFDPGFRRMVRQRLTLDAPPRAKRAGKRRVLVHGVSMGEIKAAASLVEELASAHPELEVVLSASTDTGLEMARKLYPGHTVVRFPLDPAAVVRRFLRRVDPDCVVLVELEIWPNFLRAANRAGIPIAVINGRITERSHSRYLSFKHLLPQFNRITLFCAQGEEYAARFASLVQGRERILVTGNVKADNLVQGPVEPSAELARLVGAAPGQLVLCAGSTHDPEERLLVGAWRAAAPEARLVLVPRHPRRVPEVIEELRAQGEAPQRLTALRAGEAPERGRPLIVDTIGELEGIYGLSDLVFVGGTLVEHGGQNMLEPAAQGRAVFYGPHVENFLFEAGLLEVRGGGLRLGGRGELAGALAELVTDADLRRRMGAAALAAVEEQKGATRRTLAALQERCLMSSGAR